MNKKILMMPGPVQVSDEIMECFSEPQIPHRSLEFSKILKECYEDLKYVFQTENDVYILSSSGTGAMCSALENLINPGDKVLCLVNGVFSNRFYDIAISKGAVVHKIEVEKGCAIFAEKLERVMAKESYKLVTLAHCETSTGVANDIRTLCKIIKKYGAISVVDGISSIGAMECKMDEWGIDVLISASQKGLMVPAGLSFISVSNRAYEIYKQCQNPSYYFDWRKYKVAIQNNTVPFTPAINQIFALHKSLEIIRREGLDNIISRRKNYCYKLRNGLKGLGMKLLPENDNFVANSLCALYCPEKYTSTQIIDYIQDNYGIVIANGQLELKDKILRIGTLGNINEKDIDKLLYALKKLLKK
mgnify:CR=1 FL=1